MWVISTRAGTITSDNNIFYSTGVNSIYYKGSTYGLSGLVAATSLDASSAETDPLFVDIDTLPVPKIAFPVRDLGDTYRNGIATISRFPGKVYTRSRDRYGWYAGAYVPFTGTFQ